MRKGKTFYLVGMGLAASAFAAFFSLIGLSKLAGAFLALAVASIIATVFVVHRYLVRSQVLGGSKQQAVAIRDAIAKLAATNAQLAKSVQMQQSPAINNVDRVVGSVGNSINHSLHPGGIGPEYEFADRVTRNSGKLETFALRVKSVYFRESFARAATGMTFGVDDVLRILRTMRAGKLKGVSIASSWNPRLLLTLARTMANQRILPGDIEDAELIFKAVSSMHGTKILGKSDAYIYSEVLELRGNFKGAQTVLKDTKVSRRDPVQVELLKANSAAAAEQWNQWLELVNGLFASENLTPISFNDDLQTSPLDSIVWNGSRRRSVEGPMVSVIVPTFEGARHIETTLRALVDQTWKNLEIIVVDDGSSKENKELLRGLCSKYSDVLLVEQERNLGTYPARNRALEVASGEFITVHDDDDWSHQEKIEVQARHLVKNPKASANMTRHARVHEDLRFTRINNNPSFSQPNFSSLMLRKSVFEMIGVWDNVNRGADAEFRDRLVRATGKKVEILLDIPLSFTRTHSGSLTSGEIGRGYIDPSRLFYQSAYLSAHENIEESGQNVDLKVISKIARPLNMCPGNRARHLGAYDAIFATDFAFPGGTSALTLNEIEAAADAGMRVGMVHMFSPVNTGTVNPTARALAVASREDVDVLSLGDSLNVRHLIVRHPSVLQFSDQLSSSFVVEKVTVIINNPPVLDGGTGYAFDFSDVITNCENLFGVKPILMPESGVTATLARALGRSFEISEKTWPGFVWQSDSEPIARDFSRKPVVGRHSRDAMLKWPSDLKTLREVYCANEDYTVTTMGGVSALPEPARSLLEKHSKIIPFNGMSVDEYLNSIDFWVYYHSNSLTESFGMSIIEAMSHGLVVILPKYMSANFGEAAIYCEPSQVRQVIKEFWANPEKYSIQSRIARQYARSNFSVDAFLKRMAV